MTFTLPHGHPSQRRVSSEISAGAEVVEFVPVPRGVLPELSQAPAPQGSETDITDEGDSEVETTEE